MPAVLPNQMYHSTRGIAVKLPLEEYLYLKEVKKHREGRAILAAHPEIFAGINILCGLATE